MYLPYDCIHSLPRLLDVSGRGPGRGRECVHLLVSLCFLLIFSVFLLLRRFVCTGEDQGVQQRARRWEDVVQGLQQPSGGTAGGCLSLSKVRKLEHET